MAEEEKEPEEEITDHPVPCPICGHMNPLGAPCDNAANHDKGLG